jgi:hypothetical protein
VCLGEKFLGWYRGEGADWGPVSVTQSPCWVSRIQHWYVPTFSFSFSSHWDCEALLGTFWCCLKIHLFRLSGTCGLFVFIFILFIVFFYFAGFILSISAASMLLWLGDLVLYKRNIIMICFHILPYIFLCCCSVLLEQIVSFFIRTWSVQLSQCVAYMKVRPGWSRLECKDHLQLSVAQYVSQCFTEVTLRRQIWG